jgi:hypothetical protein
VPFLGLRPRPDRNLERRSHLERGDDICSQLLNKNAMEHEIEKSVPAETKKGKRRGWRHRFRQLANANRELRREVEALNNHNSELELQLRDANTKLTLIPDPKALELAIERRLRQSEIHEAWRD